MGLNITATAATIEHLNIRRAGSGEDKITAIDAKVAIEVPAAQIMAAVGCERESDFLAGFWDPETNDKRFFGLTEVSTWAEFEDHEVTLGRNKTEAKVRKIKFSPIAGGAASATMMITVEDPSDTLVNTLVGHIKTEIKLTVLSPPELDMGQREDAA